MAEGSSRGERVFCQLWLANPGSVGRPLKGDQLGGLTFVSMACDAGVRAGGATVFVEEPRATRGIARAWRMSRQNECPSKQIISGFTGEVSNWPDMGGNQSGRLDARLPTLRDGPSIKSSSGLGREENTMAAHWAHVFNRIICRWGWIYTKTVIAPFLGIGLCFAPAHLPSLGSPGARVRSPAGGDVPLVIPVAPFIPVTCCVPALAAEFFPPNRQAAFLPAFIPVGSGGSGFIAPPGNFTPSPFVATAVPPIAPPLNLTPIFTSTTAVDVNVHPPSTFGQTPPPPPGVPPVLVFGSPPPGTDVSEPRVLLMFVIAILCLMTVRMAKHAVVSPRATFSPRIPAISNGHVVRS
jgi:hypothetical protein